MARPRKTDEAETDEVTVDEDRYEGPREQQEDGYRDAGQQYVDEHERADA